MSKISETTDVLNGRTIHAEPVMVMPPGGVSTPSTKSSTEVIDSATSREVEAKPIVFVGERQPVLVDDVGRLTKPNGDMVGGGPIYSWKDLPPPHAYVGDVIVRDIGVRHSRWTSDGTSWQPSSGSDILLDAQNYDVDFLDDRTTEQVVYEYVIPPWLIRENWSIEIEAKVTYPAFATAVTRGLRLYLGSAQMGSVNNGGATGIVTSKWHGVAVSNRNSMTSQIGEASGFAGVGGQQSGQAFAVTTADLRRYAVLQLRGFVLTLGSGTMVNTVHSVVTRLRPGI